MKASIEISYYPLKEEYLAPIQGFIDRLKSYDSIKVHVNTMSTQVFGDYFDMMKIITNEIHKSFELPGSIFVLKIINADLSPEN
ncbi:MAG: hypothetical protein ACOCPM_02285 [Bacteroidales bacterium]